MGLVQKPQPTSRFAGDNDEELLIYMSLRPEDPTAAEDAWAEFYRRHVEYLFAQCHKAYHKEIGDDVSDLVQETFIKAFARASTFHGCASKDCEVIRRIIRGWLGRIANRLFLDKIAGARECPLPDDDALGCPTVAENDRAGPNKPSKGVKLIREALGMLSEKERQVLRVTGEYYRPGKLHQRVPNKDMAELARRLGTTATNIRQIRSRAVSTVQAYLRSHD